MSNSEQNLRVHPDTGALAAMDTDLNPGGSVVALASTENIAGATLTTIYGIDSGTDSLVMLGGDGGFPSPNGGTLTTVGPLGFDVSDAAGFDIASVGVGVDAAYASLTIAGNAGP